MVRPRVKAAAAPRVPFHCSWLGVLLPRTTQECSRLGFLGDIRFYCHADAISVPPCLAAMQRGNKCLRFPRERVVGRSRKLRWINYSNGPNEGQTAGSQRRARVADIPASVTKAGKLRNTLTLTTHSKTSEGERELVFFLFDPHGLSASWSKQI